MSSSSPASWSAGRQGALSSPAGLGSFPTQQHSPRAGAKMEGEDDGALPHARKATDSSALLGLQDSEELLKLDSFIMAYGKVIPCSKRFPHDWSRCLFAHPTEAARRRDPRVHPHAGVFCTRMKKEGRCGLGDACPYAHSVFEYWLHPTRYRTKVCKDGAHCGRWLCFFAHSESELRAPSWVAPEVLAKSAAAAAAGVTARVAAAGTAASPAAGTELGSPRVAAPAGTAGGQALQIGAGSEEAGSSSGGSSSTRAVLPADMSWAAPQPPRRQAPFEWRQPVQQGRAVQHWQQHHQQQQQHQHQQQAVPGFVAQHGDSQHPHMFTPSDQQQQQQQRQQQRHNLLAQSAQPVAEQQQERQAQPQVQAGSQAISTVLLMLEGGQISAENSAVILRELLPAEALSQLQMELSYSMANLVGRAQEVQHLPPQHLPPQHAASWLGSGAIQGGSADRASLDLGWPPASVLPPPALPSSLSGQPGGLAQLAASLHEAQGLGMQQQQHVRATPAEQLLAAAQLAALSPAAEGLLPGPSSATPGDGGMDQQMLAAVAAARPPNQGRLDAATEALFEALTVTAGGYRSATDQQGGRPS